MDREQPFPCPQPCSGEELGGKAQFAQIVKLSNIYKMFARKAEKNA